MSVQLNPEQKEAVDTIDGPVLIIAGAGSGKTGVITHRMANMLNHGIPQASILSLTFTNKAAKEMAERVKGLTGKKLTNLTVSTFHAFGVQILRSEITEMGYRPNFTIYDQADQLSCLKDAARELKISYEMNELKEVLAVISDIKTRRKLWTAENDMHQPLYFEYHDHLKLYNAVDFDDLIVKPVVLFEERPDILEKYRSRYKYMMIDEFQDTSMMQYRFLKLLAETNRNVCVVGDDDQSIYSWRGANYENIINFEKDFPELKEIKLERNYRSTGVILKAANSVIANNTNRKIKELWTELASNEKMINIFHPEDDKMEGDFISDSIAALMVRENITYDQFGILIRTNSLAKTIEESLLAHNIPYTMSGGTSFFQRKEIKDIIAYLKVIINPDDDVNLIRIINIPRRGIGKSTLELITEISRNKRMSLFSAISYMVFDPGAPSVSKNIHSCLAEFLQLIENYQYEFESGKNLASNLKQMIDDLDYWPYLVHEHQKSEKVAKWKYDNVMMFADFMDRWEKNPDNLAPSLQKYINRITLSSRDDNQDDDKGKVNLMTIHASKGLEFDIVFLAGVEEHIIPHERAVTEDPKNIEEERRLFYVAITRARKNLIMTTCRKRRQMREIIEPGPSPFIKEIPEELMEYMEENTTIESEDQAKEILSRLPWK